MMTDTGRGQNFPHPMIMSLQCTVEAICDEFQNHALAVFLIIGCLLSSMDSSESEGLRRPTYVPSVISL